MILNEKNLTEWISVEIQEQETARIRNAPKGAVLFTGTTKQCPDIVETLIHMSGIQYYKGTAGLMVTYYKA